MQRVRATLYLSFGKKDTTEVSEKSLWHCTKVTDRHGFFLQTKRVDLGDIARRCIVHALCTVSSTSRSASVETIVDTEQDALMHGNIACILREWRVDWT